MYPAAGGKKAMHVHLPEGETPEEKVYNQHNYLDSFSK
jgi:hypothetical protein